MDDVFSMVINRGLKRGRGKATLHALCRSEGRFLKKPQHVRLGTCFESIRGSLSMESLHYCQLDVETPLILHSIYMGRPDLTERISNNDEVELGAIVDVMSSSTSTDTIAQGAIKQIGPSKWGEHDKFKLRKDQELILIDKVFNCRGVIHYPCNTATITRCSCGRHVHGAISESCSFYLYEHFGPPPFIVLELKSRLRKFNELIEYPDCIYRDGEQNNAPLLTNILASDIVDKIDDNGLEESDEDADSNFSIEYSQGTNEFTPSSELREIIDALQECHSVYDSDSDSGASDQEEPTDAEIRIATDVAFNKTIEKIIADAEKLANI